MSATSVTPPENNVSPAGNSPACKRPSSCSGLIRSYLLTLIGALTLASGFATWIIYRWPAALVISFVTALCGLAKALIELHVIFIKRETDAGKKTVRRRRKRALVPVVSTALLLGIGIGYGILPWMVEAVIEPSADLRVPAIVEPAQPVTVSWRNLPATDDVRLFVRAKGGGVDFIQPCRGQGRRGALSCELEVGGSEGAGRFEIRVVRVARNLSEQLAATPAEGSYLTSWPEGAQVLVSKIVTRK